MKRETLDNLPNYRLRFVLLGAAFLAAFFVSFALGRYPVMPWEVCRVLLSALWGLLRRIPVFSGLRELWGGVDPTAYTVVVSVRLPRVIAAILIGAALSSAGAAYQGLFQNPMVSPDILGASSGAGLGAAVALYLGAGYTLVSANAFLFGLAAVLLAYGISRVCRMNPVLAMVLAGMMISSLFSAGTSFIKLIADTDSQLPAITYWLMGSLSDVRMKDLVAAVPILAGLIPLFLLRWRINLLTTGEEEARSMGINTAVMRGVIIVCATLMTAASVAISGMIGWVGLVIPHFCRLIFGYDYRRILPAAILMGGAFLLIVDDVARLVATSEIPLGILTAVIGAPVFLWLIITGGDRDGN